MKTIEIAGLHFCAENLKAEENGTDIFCKDGETYFTREAAQREAKKQGKRLPTPEEFERAMSSFEGYEKGKRCKAGKLFAEKLGLKLSGYRRSDGNWSNNGYDGYSWSSAESKNFEFFEGKGRMDTFSATYAFPCVVCEDKFDGFDNSNICEVDKTMKSENIIARLGDKQYGAKFGFGLHEFLTDFNLLSK